MKNTKTLKQFMNMAAKLISLNDNCYMSPELYSDNGKAVISIGRWYLRLLYTSDAEYHGERMEMDWNAVETLRELECTLENIEVRRENGYSVVFQMKRGGEVACGAWPETEWEEDRIGDTLYRLHGVAEAWEKIGFAACKDDELPTLGGLVVRLQANEYVCTDTYRLCRWPATVEQIREFEDDAITIPQEIMPYIDETDEVTIHDGRVVQVKCPWARLRVALAWATLRVASGGYQYPKFEQVYPDKNIMERYTVPVAGIQEAIKIGTKRQNKEKRYKLMFDNGVAKAEFGTVTVQVPCPWLQECRPIALNARHVDDWLKTIPKGVQELNMWVPPDEGAPILFEAEGEGAAEYLLMPIV